MAKQARSARGKIVDFDLLSIKSQLAKQPVPVGVNQRRKFIDEKDGIKHRNQENYIVAPPAANPPAPKAELPSALAIAAEAIEISAQTAQKSKPKRESVKDPT